MSHLINKEPIDRNFIYDSLDILVVAMVQGEMSLIEAKPGRYIVLDGYQLSEDQNRCDRIALRLFDNLTLNTADHIIEVQVERSDNNWAVTTNRPKNVDQKLDELLVGLFTH